MNLDDSEPPDSEPTDNNSSNLKKILREASKLTKESSVTSRFDTSRSHNGNPYDYSPELTKGKTYALTQNPEIQDKNSLAKFLRLAGLKAPKHVCLTIEDDSHEQVTVPCYFFENFKKTKHQHH